MPTFLGLLDGEKMRKLPMRLRLSVKHGPLIRVVGPKKRSQHL